MIQLISNLNYGLILAYGTLLSVEFAGGYAAQKQKRLIGITIAIMFLVQCLFGFLFGIEFTKKIYPFISHLPLILILIFGFGKATGVAVVSVLTAYYCCHLPNWAASVAEMIFKLKIISLVTYTLSAIFFYVVLKKFFAKSVYSVMVYSRKNLFLFGFLPIFYYILDYVTTVYSDLLYRKTEMIVEFIPTAMVLFYVLFIVVYHKEVQKRHYIKLDNVMLCMQIEQALKDIRSAKASQEEARIYRHDLRHHLSLLSNYAHKGDLAKIKYYLLQEQRELEQATPSAFCENDIANLVISSFNNKATQLGVKMVVDARLPMKMDIADTELCSVLSNGLENALNATKCIAKSALRTIKLGCSISGNKLLIMIKNAYEGEISMKNGVPISTQECHGYGCRSIVAIAKKRKGFATFETEDNYFTLRIVLPLGET